MFKQESEIESQLLIEEVTLGGWVFLVRWEHDRFRAEFTVWRSESVNEDGTEAVFEELPEAQGSVVWGGCMNLNVTGAHWCCLSHIEQHSLLLKYLYARGVELADA